MQISHSSSRFRNNGITVIAPKPSEIESRMYAIAIANPTCKTIFHDECLCEVCNQIGFTTSVSTTVGTIGHVCASCWAQISLLKGGLAYGIR